MSTRMNEKNHGYNHFQAQENLRNYINKMNSTNPELHLLKKSGTPHYKAIAKHFGFFRKEPETDYIQEDARTVRKFFCDEPKTFNAETFKKMAEKSEIHEAYWRGITTLTDEAEYKRELKKRDDLEELKRLENKEHQIVVEHYEHLFDALGYRYECSPNWRSIDRPNFLSKRKSSEDKQELSDEELSTVIGGLSSMLGYLLYMQQKTQDK